MITQNDVVESVSALLRQHYPDVTIYTNLVTEGFDRPSFLVENQELRMEPAGDASVELELSVHIVCFEEIDEYYDSQLESLNLRQLQVMALFAPGYLRVKERTPHVTQIFGGVGGRDYSDVTVTLSWCDDVSALLPPAPQVPLMAEINFRMEATN